MVFVAGKEHTNGNSPQSTKDCQRKRDESSDFHLSLAAKTPTNGRKVGVSLEDASLACNKKKIPTNEATSQISFCVSPKPAVAIKEKNYASRQRRLLKSSIKLRVKSSLKMNRVTTWGNSISRVCSLNTFVKLKQFNEPVSIILKIVDFKRDFTEFVNAIDQFSSVTALFDLLATVSLSKFDYHKAQVFQAIVTPLFLSKLKSLISNSLEVDLIKFVQNFVDIYKSIFKLHDVLVTDALANDLEEVASILKGFVCSHSDDHDASDLLNKFLDLLTSRHLLLTAKSCFPLNILHEEAVENNVILGPYLNFDHYISVHYRLLKEDFQNTLRTGIINYIEFTTSKKRNRTNIELILKIFPNVTLSTIIYSNKLKFKVTFRDKERVKKLQDSANTDFLNGSLVLMTSNNFENYYMARVESRNPLEKNKSHIYVDLVVGPPIIADSMDLLLIEPCQLFEPYYRVLNVLRTLDGRTYPFVRYFVNVETHVSPPAYARGPCHLSVGNCKISLWDDATWPTAEELGLNLFQLEGLKLALRNELAIIQGPPGTGKTFLVRKILETLLDNKHLWHKSAKDASGKIVVVCYKNQSLDQLLNGLVKNRIKVLRVGMQSKDESLDSYNLTTLRGPKCHFYFEMLHEIDNEVECVIRELNETKSILKTIDVHEGIINVMEFPSYIPLSAENQKYLMKNYSNWLIGLGVTTPIMARINSILVKHGDDVCKTNNSNLYWTSLLDIRSLWNKINSRIERHCSSTDFTQGEIDRLRSIADYLKNVETLLLDLFRIVKRIIRGSDQAAVYKIQQQFAQVDQPSLVTLSLSSRWLLYASWIMELRQHILSELNTKVLTYQEMIQRKSELRDLITAQKIAQCDAKVIGLTTTTAARYCKVFECLKPKIVVVEEAAEVVEAHIVSSLSQYCQHLVLVGDHQQLRPLTSSRIIGKEANLEVSLFERLVNNGFPHCTLNIQYRMRPQICSLISPFIYPNLVNHESVKEISSVLGLAENVYFVDHAFHEEQDRKSLSKHNTHEAKFHVALCDYLVKQGYKPSEITILAMYGEQETYFHKEIAKYPQLEEIIVATVDSFQGKENEIVLLSLVRNNDEGNIGFLSNKNRVNVALSRAKRGLYITGNASNLTGKSDLWRNVIGELTKTQCIGATLPFKCLAHGEITKVSGADDIRALKNGGCSKVCNVTLDCQHKCEQLCHPLDLNHESIFCCSEVCKKKMNCSHLCSRICHVNQNLSCFCESCTPVTTCNAQLDCGHVCKEPAHEEDNDHRTTFQCTENCNTMLWCGHICDSICHSEDPQHKQRYKCPIMCQGRMGCGHPCNYSRPRIPKHGCTKHTSCKLPCQFVFGCGHKCRKVCHIKDREHIRGCSECARDKNSIQNTDMEKEKTGAVLSNLVLLTESLTITSPTCKVDGQCQFVYPCKHPCTLRRGHKIILHLKCRKSCEFVYPCNHKCRKSCHGRTHKKCTNLCCVTYSCGHKGKVPCSLLKNTAKNPCPPCSACNYIYACGHTCLKTKEHSHLSCQKCLKRKAKH